MDPESSHPDDVKKAIDEKIDAAMRAMDAGNFERCAKLLDEANAVLPPQVSSQNAASPRTAMEGVVAVIAKPARITKPAGGTANA